jgi:hypothetical protein
MITVAVQNQLSYSQPPKWRPSSTSGEVAKIYPKSNGGGGGGGVLVSAPLPAQAIRAQVASGYTAGDTILVISPMSLSSHFTFLCIAAVGR